ncbi:hypothetical protein DFH09DRAFT_1313077 [Mycena vulgaris]|nr:hypothetical protein DFH09DRAFT_1313077 [Mycena vulgaris]
METDDRVVCACPAVIFHLASAPFPPAPHDTVTPLHRTGPSRMCPANANSPLVLRMRLRHIDRSVWRGEYEGPPLNRAAFPSQASHRCQCWFARTQLTRFRAACRTRDDTSAPPCAPRTRPNHLRRRRATVVSRIHPRVPRPSSPHTRISARRRRPPSPSNENAQARMRAGGSEHGAPAVAMGSPSPRRCTPHPSSLHLLHPRRLAAAPAAPPSRSISICLILAQFEFACLAFSLGLRADLDRFGIH